MTEILYSMGPQHAGTGHMRMKIRLSGDMVIEAIPDPGYVHRGAEKLCETKEIIQNIPLVERVCLPDTTSANWGYVKAIEQLSRIDPPVTAKYLRVLLAEMNRVISHLYW
ncbi:MAG: NADH-quinone oxidoreductase subunit NuoD, partial [Promethearchaeota archaeon]